jgi:hypothetical protein
MALGADSLDVVVMFRGVAKVVVVLVTARVHSWSPTVATISAWQRVRMGSPTSPHLDIYTLPCLQAIAITRRMRSGAVASLTHW